MRKETKAEVIEQIAVQLGEAEAIYAVDYRGLSVPQAAELRASLREQDATFRIVKNTLTLRAADKAGLEAIKDMVADGPTALTFVRGDAAAAAKALDTFSRRADVLQVKGGVMGGRVLAVEDFRSLARLPSRDTLNAQFAGIVASPITGLVRGLGSMVSGLALALGQLREQRAAEAPAAGAATEEPAAADDAAEQPESEEPATEADSREGDQQPEEQSDAEKEAQ